MIITERFKTDSNHIMAFLKIAKMGAITLKDEIHYKYPKAHKDNTLFRRFEELEHVVQWRDISMFPVLYLIAQLKHGYKKNPYEIEAKAKAARWMKSRSHPDYKNLTDDQYLDIGYASHGLTRK